MMSDSKTMQVADGWFCMLGGQELGPLTFEEIAEYAANEQLTADDEVKLGENGKWRRVGSIGRLMAVVPYKAVEKNIVPTAKVKTPPVEMPVLDLDDDLLGIAESSDFVEDDEIEAMMSPSATPETPAPGKVASVDSYAAYCATFEEARGKIQAALLAQAEADFKAAEDQAKSHVAWATAPKADREWWGWASGVEFGPVDFQQVFGLAKNGQLKPNDLVRNGQFAQFGPSSAVPGLYTAVAMTARANEMLSLAKTIAQRAISVAGPSPTIPDAVLNARPVAPPEAPAPRRNPTPPKSDPVIPAARESAVPAPRERTAPGPYAAVMEELATPEPRRPVASMSSSGSMSVNRAVSAAAAKPVKKAPSQRSSINLSGLMEAFKEPKTMGSVGAIALVLLIVGWSYLPKSKAADIKRYQVLKQILDDIRNKRESPTEMAAIKTRAAAASKEMVPVLKKEATSSEPAKQALLWAVRDELPRVLEKNESLDNLTTRLNEAAVELGLQPRSTLVATIKGAPLPDD